MAHLHSVYDSDTHFSINPITRALRNEASGKTSLIQYDHNSERFTFEIPRFIEGHDMSQCNVIRVHYINIDAKTKAEVSGVYEVDDMQISPDSDDVVICSWLISRNATQLVGSLNFLIRFTCVNDDVVDYAWNTAVYSGISVASGINADETYEDDYSDILENWKASVMQELKEDLPKAFDDLISPDGTGSVIRVRDTNGGKDLTFWIGTQVQYERLVNKIQNCIYIITDDLTIERLQNTVVSLENRVNGIADHITRYWEDDEFRHYFREYNSGSREGTLQAVFRGLSFTTEHNGFYANDAGRIRAVLDAITMGVVPEYCSVNVSKATMTNDSGEVTFAPPIMAMVCGTPERLDGYGAVSPRILLLSDEQAENVTVELEFHCVWKWGDNQ